MARTYEPGDTEKFNEITPIKALENWNKLLKRLAADSKSERE